MEFLSKMLFYIILSLFIGIIFYYLFVLTFSILGDSISASALILVIVIINCTIAIVNSINNKEK